MSAKEIAIVKRMKMVAEDMKNDAAEFEGQLFNGKTVAQYFGRQGAAIAALANTIRELSDMIVKAKDG